MDRVYRADIPALRKALEELKVAYADVESDTDWIALRIDPMLEHARRLETLLRSRRFSGEVSRLRRGVPMFHADLVYLRENVRGLRRILEPAKVPRRRTR